MYNAYLHRDSVLGSSLIQVIGIYTRYLVPSRTGSARLVPVPIEQRQASKSKSHSRRVTVTA